MTVIGINIVGTRTWDRVMSLYDLTPLSSSNDAFTDLRSLLHEKVDHWRCYNTARDSAHDECMAAHEG